METEIRIGDRIADIRECGHTYEMHINCSDRDLIDRLLYGDLDNEMRCLGTKMVSTRFTDETTAFHAINKTLEKNQDVIAEWVRMRYDKRLVVYATFMKPLGYGFAKNTSFDNKYSMYRCALVLELGYNGSVFHIVTGYPDANEAMTKRIKQDQAVWMSNRLQRRHAAG